MTDYIDGISSLNAITAKIEALKNQPKNAQPANNPELANTDSFLLQQQMNFNQMLNDLMSTSNEEDKNKQNNDIFDMFMPQNDKTASSGLNTSQQYMLNIQQGLNQNINKID